MGQRRQNPRACDANTDFDRAVRDRKAGAGRAAQIRHGRHRSRCVQSGHRVRHEYDRHGYDGHRCGRRRHGPRGYNPHGCGGHRCAHGRGGEIPDRNRRPASNRRGADCAIRLFSGATRRVFRIYETGIAGLRVRHPGHTNPGCRASGQPYRFAADLNPASLGAPDRDTVGFWTTTSDRRRHRAVADDRADRRPRVGQCRRTQRQ